MRSLIFPCLVLLLLASACTPTPRPDSQKVDPEQQARDYLLQENYSAAATEYLRLAGEYNAPRYLLRAADSMLLDGDATRATQTLDNVDTASLDDTGKAEFAILRARLALRADNPAGALELLDFDLPDTASTDLRTDYHRSRAEAFNQTGKYVPALRERIRLGSLLDNTDAISNNNQSIWDLIAHFDQDGLENLLTDADTLLQGWIELARIERTRLYDREALETAINEWQSRYPSHPAGLQKIPEIMALAEEINLQPDSIALLLPFEGQYTEASDAIREGFLAAWYESDERKPAIRIYNTSNGDIKDLYRQAVDEGADFIVGPLDKDAVATIYQLNELPVRTLALNRLHPEVDPENGTGDSVHKLYQFGLLPEDEAVNVADRAWFNGHARALVITPDTQWGNRVFSAFSERWQKHGGTVLEHTRISPVVEDLSEPVKALLNIDESERREKELTAMLRRKLHYEPRRRQDADLIFLAAPPVIARQLVPQMRFYRADDLPVYSISRIYPGIHEPQANSDIDNVIFSDMPWLVDPDHEYSPLQQTLNRNWQQDESPYRRLYAFGIDAYRIIPHLGKLQMTNGKFAGETGQLSVNRNGTITREQVWARVVEGIPRPLEGRP